MSEGSNFSLVKFDGKPIEKLIEVVSQGIGTLYRPIAIRKEAKAKAFEIEVIAKAKATSNAEGKFAELDTYNIIEQKLLHQQVKKQNNIDKIVDVAFDQINQEPEVSSEKVDSDWTTRFFNIAEDISNEEMQLLWGRVLSGEIKKPGSFSLRTLDLLKNINKEEAEIFTKFAQLNVKHKTGHFIPYIDMIYFEKQFNIPYSDILIMIELGLLTSGTSLGLNFPALKKPVELLYEIGETGIYVTTNAHNTPHSLPILAFTKIALELSTLIPVERNLEYVTYVCKALSTPNTKIIVGTITNEEDQKSLTDTFEFHP